MFTSFAPHFVAPCSKSGLNFSTPAAMFDSPGATINMRPLLQLSCSGELGVSLLSGNLQMAVHAPYAQDLISFFAQRVRVLQEARRSGWGAARGGDRLSSAQYEFRFMLHHAAYWCVVTMLRWLGSIAARGRDTTHLCLIRYPLSSATRLAL